MLMKLRMDDPLQTVRCFMGPRNFDGYVNEDGSVTPSMRTKNNLELVVIAGMHAALTCREYRNLNSKRKKNCRPKFTDCRCSINQGMFMLHEMLESPKILYGNDMANLRKKFKSCAKVLSESVHEKQGSYHRHTVVLKVNRRDNVHRFVSFVLCGSDRRCHAYVTANTVDDAERWKKLESAKVLTSIDPRRH